MARDDEWSRFVRDARADLAKDATLGGSALPRWLLVALLRHPVLASLIVGVIAGAFGCTDTPVDWRFIIGLGVAIAAALMFVSFVLRRRVRRYLGQPWV